MHYPTCNLRCNGMLNCQQMEHLLIELDEQDGREDTISFYRAMLKRNYKMCPLNSQALLKSTVSMY